MERTTAKKNKYEIDMCNGTIMDKLISFSLPLMLSGILQLMFNAVDIIVVGRFSGSQALAAVGSTSALINVFTNLFIGISLGANVLTARFYAAGREKEVSETVHTAITLALVSGLSWRWWDLFFQGALALMGTPDDVIGLSALYMRIYFLGMPFFMLYNYGAAILRAVGDTKRPLLFLMIAGVINACLNMVLVIVFKLGVAGGGDRHGDFTDDFLCAGAAVPLPVGEQLPAAFFRAWHERVLLKADLFGRHSGRNPEYGH